MKLIDSHCHLNYDYEPKVLADLVREAREAGIEWLITVGTEVATTAEVQAISELYPEIFHTVGMHPHETIDFKDEDIATLECAAAHPKCVAIGEIGLDYHYDHSPRPIQVQRLNEQLALALRVKKPIVIHSREGEDDLLKALTHYATQITDGRVPGVIHCFTGTYGFGQACLDLGFYISFSGILTFKNAEELRACARAFPLERLLVETDSPFLAPIPYRGKKCEPAMVKLTAQKLAEVKGLTFEKVALATYANTRRVFGF